MMLTFNRDNNEIKTVQSEVNTSLDDLSMPDPPSKFYHEGPENTAYQAHTFAIAVKWFDFIPENQVNRLIESAREEIELSRSKLATANIRVPFCGKVDELRNSYVDIELRTGFVDKWDIKDVRDKYYNRTHDQLLMAWYMVWLPMELDLKQFTKDLRIDHLLKPEGAPPFCLNDQ